MGMDYATHLSIFEPDRLKKECCDLGETPFKSQCKGGPMKSQTQKEKVVAPPNTHMKKLKGSRLKENFTCKHEFTI